MLINTLMGRTAPYIVKGAKDGLRCFTPGLESRDLPVVDELGFLPLHRHPAELPFQAIADYYEQGSVTITTYLEFGHWNTMIKYDRQAALVSLCTFCQAEAVVQQV